MAENDHIDSDDDLQLAAELMAAEAATSTVERPLENAGQASSAAEWDNQATDWGRSTSVPGPPAASRGSDP